ncbi:hypothetical protein MASR2M18_07240 [Ignavibacteria bacterium]|nr:DUF4920 domain-containing protein [Bacteroidota bacterium]MCZ2132695.1 DUF4920 domain-containing protein [Bacteroidota bacterium]
MSFYAGNNNLRIIAAILPALVAVIIYGCGKGNAHYGAKPTVYERPVSTSEALQPQYFERTIQLAGTIRAVCKNEGCWIAVSDGKKTVGVMFRSSAFAAPLDCAGKSVVLEGRMIDRIFNASDVQKFDTEAGDNHDFCLLGEDNCGQKRLRNDKSGNFGGDRRVQVFEAASMTIFN